MSPDSRQAASGRMKLSSRSGVKLPKPTRPAICSEGPTRRHGLQNVPVTWVTLLGRTDSRAVQGFGLIVSRPSISQVLGEETHYHRVLAHTSRSPSHWYKTRRGLQIAKPWYHVPRSVGLRSTGLPACFLASWAGRCGEEPKSTEAAQFLVGSTKAKGRS